MSAAQGTAKPSRSAPGVVKRRPGQMLDRHPSRDSGGTSPDRRAKQSTRLEGRSCPKKGAALVSLDHVAFPPALDDVHVHFHFDSFLVLRLRSPALSHESRSRDAACRGEVDV